MVIHDPKPEGYREYQWGLNFTDGEWEDPDWDMRKGLQQKMEEAAKFTCSQKQITSVNDYTPTERWNSVNSIDIWANMSWWYADELEAGNVNLDWSAWMADKMNAKENMNCNSLKPENGCSDIHQCDDTNVPAGFFILNSMASINNMLSNLYTATQFAAGDMDREIPELTDTFSPQADESWLTTAVIIDFVSLGYVSMSAPFWNSLIKKSDWFKKGDVGNTHGVWKDLSKDWVTQGLTLAKDLTRAEATSLADREFTTAMQDMIKIWARSTTQLAKSIFDGSPGSLDTLTKWFSDGKLITVDVRKDQEEEDDDIEELKNMVKKPVWAQLIPRAWRMSNRNLGAFVLKSRRKCDEDVPRVSSEMKESNGVCIDGEMYVLASAEVTSSGCRQQGDTGRSCFSDFLDPPGADRLDGTDDNFSGITREDIVRAAVATWKYNGEQNYVGESARTGEQVEASLRGVSPLGFFGITVGGLPTSVTGDDILDEIIENGVRTAGIVNMPVCDDFESTRNQESAANSVGSGQTGNYPFYPNWPCDE